MAGVFQSRIVRNLAQPVLCAGGAALAVATYETLLQVGAAGGYCGWVLRGVLQMGAAGGRCRQGAAGRTLHLPPGTRRR